MIVFVVALAVMKFDFGPMKLHEFNAITKGDLFTSGQDDVESSEEINANPKGRLWCWLCFQL